MSVRKKMLIYAHYYFPDVASTGQLLQALAEKMLDTFDITIVCVVPSYTGVIDDQYRRQKFYEEEINGVTVIRIRVPEFNKSSKTSRIRNIASYFMGARKVTHILNRKAKYDYVFTISQPPLLGGLLGVYGKKHLRTIDGKRPKLIYSIQDFNPEQIMAVGYLHNKVLLGIMLAIDKHSCQKSDLVVTVGRDLLERLKNRFAGKNVPNNVMINNWIDEKEIYPLDSDNPGVVAFKKRYGLEGKFIIMYSGNIGLYYDLEELIKVIEHFKNARTRDGKDVIFAFVGAGSVLGSLMRYTEAHRMENTVFIPYQDKDKLIYSLNAADVHWCVNAKGIKGVSCPSKYYGLAGVGKPVLGVLERGSEIRMLIEATNGGLVCEPGQYDEVEKNIEWFISHAGSQDLVEMGLRGHKYLVENLTKEMSIEKYKSAISKL